MGWERRRGSETTRLLLLFGDRGNGLVAAGRQVVARKRRTEFLLLAWILAVTGV